MDKLSVSSVSIWTYKDRNLRFFYKMLRLEDKSCRVDLFVQSRSLLVFYNPISILRLLLFLQVTISK